MPYESSNDKPLCTLANACTGYFFLLFAESPLVCDVQACDKFEYVSVWTLK